jgi:hypothetical protein
MRPDQPHGTMHHSPKYATTGTGMIANPTVATVFHQPVSR